MRRKILLLILELIQLSLKRIKITVQSHVKIFFESARVRTLADPVGKRVTPQTRIARVKLKTNFLCYQI